MESFLLDTNQEIYALTKKGFLYMKHPFMLGKVWLQLGVKHMHLTFQVSSPTTRPPMPPPQHPHPKAIRLCQGLDLGFVCMEAPTSS